MKRGTTECVHPSGGPVRRRRAGGSLPRGTAQRHLSSLSPKAGPAVPAGAGGRGQVVRLHGAAAAARAGGGGTGARGCGLTAVQFQCWPAGEALRSVEPRDPGPAQNLLPVSTVAGRLALPSQGKKAWVLHEQPNAWTGSHACPFRAQLTGQSPSRGRRRRGPNPEPAQGTQRCHGVGEQPPRLAAGLNTRWVWDKPMRSGPGCDPVRESQKSPSGKNHRPGGASVSERHAWPAPHTRVSEAGRRLQRQGETVWKEAPRGPQICPPTRGDFSDSKYTPTSDLPAA